MTPDEILDCLETARKALSVTQTRLTEAIAAIQALELKAPPLHVCRECGATHRGPRSLAEHRYHVHEAEVPVHYLAAERMAGELQDEAVRSAT